MGYYIAYLALISEAKDEMQSKISESGDPDDEITMVKLSYNNGAISESDFSFVSEDEFIYKGEMYDLVRSEVKDGFIYLYSINDRKEDEVNLALARHLEDNFDSSSQKKISGILKNLIKQGIPQENSVQNPKLHGSEKNYNQKEFYTTRIIYDISPPPPKA